MSKTGIFNDSAALMKPGQISVSASRTQVGESLRR